MAGINPDTYLSNVVGIGQTPSPWFTVANQFLPRNLHDVIRWARYITIQSPVTTEVIRKLSTYPITDFIIESKDEGLRKKYKEIFKSFKLKQALQDVGFDYYTIGNVFTSIYFPIHRTLTCPSCKTVFSAKKAPFVKFHQWQFKGICPDCSSDVIFQRKDTKSTNIGDMNLIKWNPEHIAVNHNPITGESEYYYKVPNSVKQKIQKGDRLFIDSVPWSIVEAVRYNQDFKFDNDSIFHLKNVSTGAMVEGLSVPPLITLFSLVFYQATLRKANESIATEHLTPLRVVFPTAQTGNSDPVVSMSMRNFANNMQEAIKKHKKDNNHFLVAPVPVGYQQVGGDGKNLLVAQEIQQAEESILLSLGVSRELLSGTTNWTSSTVGLRMLDNTMRSYISQLGEMINWVMTKVASYLNLEVSEVNLAPFKLIDDEVLKQNMLQLVEQGQASLSTLYELYGMDYNEELDRIKEDMVSKAANDVETKFEIEQAEFLASKKVGEKIDDSGSYQNLLQEAQEVASELMNSDDQTRNAALIHLKTTNYPLYMMTFKLMNEGLQHPGALPVMDQGQGDPNAQGGDPNAEEGGDPEEEQSGGEGTPEGKEKDQKKDQKAKDKKESGKGGKVNG